VKAAMVCAVALMLTGCIEQRAWRSDPADRQRVFRECMAALPKGPERTVYNDWAEVVDSCDQAAYDQTRKLVCIYNCPKVTANGKG
jgi:hypothetical protein